MKSLVNLPFDVFSEAYIDTCISIFEKVTPLLETQDFLIKQFGKKEKLTIKDNLLVGAEKLPLKNVFLNPDYKIFASPINYHFLNKLHSDKITNLGTLTDSCQGIVESFFNYSETPKTENHLPYIIGQGYRYEYQIDSKKFIDFSAEKSLWKYYTNPRILMRRIVSRGNRIMGTFVDETFVCKKDLNPFIVTDKQYSPLYILANLNSLFHSFLYVNVSTLATKDDFRQTTIQELRKLPIRRISFTTPPARRAALFEEAKALYSTEAPDSVKKLLDFVGARLSAKPEESDVVHDLLAHLAERMIEMNKEKNAEIKGFLRWLEGEIGASLEELANKTALKEYYAHDFGAFAGALVKNKKKLKEGYDPTRREPKDKLRDEYNASVRKLAPLMRRIEATDGLIDAIVYRLYGLSEDEIKIVEGSIAGEKTKESSKTEKID